MARKKELMELENPAMEGNTPLDGTDTEAGASPAEGDSALTETDGDGTVSYTHLRAHETS